MILIKIKFICAIKSISNQLDLVFYFVFLLLFNRNIQRKIASKLHFGMTVKTINCRLSTVTSILSFQTTELKNNTKNYSTHTNKINSLTISLCFYCCIYTIFVVVFVLTADTMLNHFFSLLSLSLWSFLCFQQSALKTQYNQKTISFFLFFHNSNVCLSLWWLR